MGETPRKIRSLGCVVDALTMEQALQTLLRWLSEIADARAQELPLPHCRYVVTPNLDHAVMLQTDRELGEAYRDASLVLADGMPLVWASYLTKKRLPERVAGSDLTPNLLQALPQKTRIFLLGAQEEASIAAVKNITDRYPQIEIADRLSPPLGFEHSRDWSDTITKAISASSASLIVVGLGAPKQELWVHQHAHRLPGTVVLCVGATIDFFAGRVKRSPVWIQKLGAEWLYRMASDPRRLMKRYGRDLVHLPGLLLKDLTSPNELDSD